ncbi:hypothetical protein L914_07420 [Phytophthora nicotianae]|uniref:Uncharacterized protein n=1 Tax=Phytophthora nicotianae TaxID=4792 RepID=W2NHB5_PHYNI|nr:hypothetical protein L914_07420 [Phytophthora nicotianae]
MPSKYFLCVCTSRGSHARRTSRGCSRALHLSWRSFYVRVLRTAGLHHCAALDASAYQTGYNHLVANVEHILDQIGLPVNITTTLHGNVDKAAHTVVTETMDLLSVMTLIYLTYFLCTRTRASDAGGIWPRSTPISSGL